MSQRNSVYPIVLDSVDTSVIAADTWTPFNTSGLPEACFFLRITNASQTTVYISFDSEHQHLILGAGESKKLDFQTNSYPGSFVPKVRRGTVISVQGDPDMAGFVYLAGYYNRDSSY